MADIALASKSDISTVSRTLRKAEDQVRTEKGRAIWRIAAEMGYRPNLTAASLRTNSSRLITVFVPRLRDEVLALMHEGIDQVLAAAGYQSIVVPTGDDPAEQVAKLEMAIQRGVDGILIGDARSDSDFMDNVRRLGLPFFLFNRPLDGYASVTSGDYQGGMLAAGHLAQMCPGPVAVYGGMPYAQNLARRVQGFRDGFEAAGRTLPPNLVLDGGLYAEDGAMAAHQLMQQLEPPFGLFAVNDTAAIGALGEFYRAGLRAGRDVFVVGFNDISLAGAIPVGLTTIRSSMAEVGSRAAEALLGRISGENPGSRTVPVDLMIRESTQN
ncbi:LacI family transcriptional regulator [Arthrobacter gengyunqii]|uniref:LacI family transcriptional regulator n=1 Tax=Arthrobacter gengyunqii TaxID=2886940 RepID=A0A9X1S6R6_9MICC|nr:LacI family DNA-binding transcriptional regulator [Arthrobacter gengyunqii]MCC3270103.1 LacI family transcriptional regulator [Arthrobacter gengyunqii]UOY96811.1 LacI family transcriptional regulator [Arthrobacter gengyunqii]